MQLPGKLSRMVAAGELLLLTTSVARTIVLSLCVFVPLQLTVVCSHRRHAGRPVAPARRGERSRTGAARRGSAGKVERRGLGRDT